MKLGVDVAPNGDYMFDLYVICKDAYLGQDMELCVWVTPDGDVYYYYWMESPMPTHMQVYLGDVK